MLRKGANDSWLILAPLVSAVLFAEVGCTTSGYHEFVEHYQLRNPSGRIPGVNGMWIEKSTDAGDHRLLTVVVISLDVADDKRMNIVVAGEGSPDVSFGEKGSGPMSIKYKTETGVFLDPVPGEVLEILSHSGDRP